VTSLAKKSTKSRAHLGEFVAPVGDEGTGREDEAAGRLASGEPHAGEGVDEGDHLRRAGHRTSAHCEQWRKEMQLDCASGWPGGTVMPCRSSDCRSPFDGKAIGMILAALQKPNRHFR
jgi:hypothetical protein